MSAQVINTMSSTTTSMQPNNAAADLKPKGDASAKVKVYGFPLIADRFGTALMFNSPAAYAKMRNSARDECMLFSTSSDPQAACKDLVGQYRSCMAGYGFNLAGTMRKVTLRQSFVGALHGVGLIMQDGMYERGKLSKYETALRRGCTWNGIATGCDDFDGKSVD